ncbi:MAG: deoxyribonuclease IV [Clostridiales bacterium]|nr:deoxyribonuclease IV [Clostridiales bacterium]
MLRIGCHLSASGGYLAMGRTAERIGANTFAFFTRNPRGGAAKQIDEKDAAAFTELAGNAGISELVAHSPYTLNPCSSDKHLREFARDTMRDDLVRMEYTPGNFYNFHPGCHTGQGVEAGIDETAQMLNDVLTPEQTTTVLIETMAGKGSEIGKTFGEIRDIMDRVERKDKIGVCLDTCHIWEAGYDVRDGLDGVLAEFDEVIGLSHLRAIHLNDSMNPRGAKKDRHAKIGEGQIGLEALVRVMNHEKLHTLPFILETPTDDDGHKVEIEMLRSLYKWQ